MALNVKILFDLDNSKIKIEDHTDYTVGYSGAIHGTVFINGPGGTVHPGGTPAAPDLTIGAGQYALADPTQASRKFNINSPAILAGVWQVIYTVYDNAGAGTAQAVTYDFTYAYAAPAVALTLSTNVSASLVTSVDSTDYTNSGALTVSSLTRTHSLSAPAGAQDASGTLIPNPANSGSSASITYTGITTGAWSSTLSTLVEWVFGSGTSMYYVLQTLSSAQTTEVVTDLGLCNVYCCLKALNMRYEEAKCKNKDLAEDYKAKIEEVTRLLTLLGQAVSCGLTGDATQYLTEIKRISECGTECDCYDVDNVPTLIPITSAVSTTAYSLQSASSRINIDSSGSGTSADPVVYRVDLGADVSGDISYIAGGIQSMANRLRTLNDLIANTSREVNAMASSPEMHYFSLTNDFTEKTVSYSNIFLTGSRFYDGSLFNLSMPLSTTAAWSGYNNFMTVSNLYQSGTWAGVPYMISGVIRDNVHGLILDIHITSYELAGNFAYTIKDSNGVALTNTFLQSNYRNIVIDFTLISNVLNSI